MRLHHYSIHTERTYGDWIKKYVQFHQMKSRQDLSIDPSVVNKAIKAAAKKTGITKRVSAHTFRHSFATHLLQRGNDPQTIQALLGHSDVSTTMIYTHVLHQSGQGVPSPLDDLDY